MKKKYIPRYNNNRGEWDDKAIEEYEVSPANIRELDIKFRLAFIVGVIAVLIALLTK